MNHFEKEPLGLFPTPIYRLPNMSRELGTNVWIKRDDLCGVALGGNKVRKLDTCYTGKAFAGLVRRARKGFYKPEDNVLFVHTGGAGGLFAQDWDAE